MCPAETKARMTRSTQANSSIQLDTLPQLARVTSSTNDVWCGHAETTLLS